MKQCNRCKEYKDLESFYPHPKTKDRLTGICIDCQLTANRLYRHSETGFINYSYRKLKYRSKLKGLGIIGFSLEEFTNWIKNQSNFNTLFKSWVDSNYSKNLYPSVDRLDDYGNYVFTNMQLITWEENNLKGNKNIREGINTKLSKGVLKIDKYSGKTIDSYPSIRLAARLNGFNNHSNIIRVCKGIRKTAYGFIWKYDNN